MSDYSMETLECFQSDRHFDSIYPQYIQKLSAKHWTPLDIAFEAARYLAVQPDSKILDIGSGVGKFCISGASHFRDCHFYGVEQRKWLVDLAESARQVTGAENVRFIHGNFTLIDPDQYDHFYFYNSFYENLVDEELHIDDHIDHNLRFYEQYTRHLYRVLAERPSGTRLATYHTFREAVPESYDLVGSYDHLLRFWIKK